MSPDAIIEAAVRNRANRAGQVERLQPVAAASRERQHELARKLADLKDRGAQVKAVAQFMNTPDFFPTPRGLVARMIKDAELRPGMRILEPSAGKGDIALAARAEGCAVTCHELSFGLAGVLLGHGFDVNAGDFLAVEPPAIGFDRVIMNPPFSNGADARHIMHAFRFLAPGGRLVGIACEGPFFRQDNLSRTFRDFVDTHGASEKLPDDSFNNAQSERNTSVNTRIVILNA